MNSRKSTILEKITEYTRKSILDNSFQFENCNAYDLSIELKIDRSNVSRILNQLFNEYLLIKINGRPTTYLSREVIVNEFHYSNAPQTLSSKENLKEQILLNDPSENNPAGDFKIIGSNTGESLNEVIDKLLPFFLHPQRNPLMLVLFAEKGSGRKYFCESLFQHAIKKKTFPKQNTFVTAIYDPHAANSDYILQQITPENVSMILIEVMSTISTSIVYGIKSSIFNLYYNRKCPQPIVLFLADKDVTDEKVFSTLTPCIVSFPNFSQRRIPEKIKLVLSLIQESADDNQTHIRTNREVLTRLLSSEYKYNLYQLRNEINYAVSNSIYFAKNNHATLLPNFLSNELRNNQIENQNYINEVNLFIESALPQFIDFVPGTSCSLLEVLSSDNLTSILQEPSKPSFSKLVLDDVLHSDVILTETIQNERMHFLFGTFFLQTKLRFDLPLLDHLYTILEQMIQNTFVLDYNVTDDTLTFSPTALKIANEISEKIMLTFNVTLRKSYRDYLRLFIDESLNALNKNKIIYVLMTHNSQLSENYARYMNHVSKTRNYYAIPFTASDKRHYTKFIRKAQQLMRTVDDTKEIILISDKEPLTTLATPIVAALNRPVLSLYPVSLPLLMKTNEIMQEDNSHAVPLVRKVFYFKKEILREFATKTSVYPVEYISQNITRHFERFFTNTNTILANKILFNILKDIFDYFNCELQSGLILEFLLHGNYMIQRSAAHKIIEVEYLENFIQENIDIYHLIKQRLNQSRELLTLNISDAEIAVLCDLMAGYLDFVRK